SLHSLIISGREYRAIISDLSYRRRDRVDFGWASRRREAAHRIVRIRWGKRLTVAAARRPGAEGTRARRRFPVRRRAGPAPECCSFRKDGRAPRYRARRE